MKPLEIFFGVLRIPVDFLLTILAFLLAYQLRQITDFIPGIQLPITFDTFPEFSEYLILSVAATTILITIFAAAKLYNLKRPEPLHKQITKVFISTLIWLFGIITYYFLIRTFPFSRLALINSWFLTFLFISIGRTTLQFIQNQLYKRGIAQTRVLLIGAGEHTEEILSNFFKNHQYKCLGYLESEDQGLKKTNYLGNLNNLAEIVKTHRVEKIIQCQEKISENQEINLLDFCREHQIEYSFIPGELEMQRSNIEIETPEGIPLITLKPTPLDGWGRVIKRAFDFFGALILLILLSPIYLICALLIKLDDPKSTILFRYLDDGSRVKRVGQKGKLFPFYKFRTMKPNTHNLRYQELAHLNTREGTPMVKIKNDPRVTKIGRIMRKTSLDELPQLINVLKGEMSLVGPRPHLPEEVANYQKHHKFVLTIKPGITGMAQVSGRSDLDFEQEVKLDSFYIENWSLLLDLKILVQTILVVFKRYEE
jgi:exopolysaccharide biosynthesis polyprenyl glycosylphosphotransferase